jgi:elongation factor 1-alpha
MPREKPHINLVVVGHVKHGKSTTFGRLLFELGRIDERKAEELKKLAAQEGHESYWWAYVLDRLVEERKRALTIEAHHEEFETKKYHFTLIDAPGHKDFIKNMIVGASQADAAVLVVDAKEGPKEQTLEHMMLLRTFGIPQIIVAINKMDLVNYSKERFEELKKQIAGIFQKLGYKFSENPDGTPKPIGPDNQIIFVPIASWHGVNISKKPEKEMPWWKGPTLVEAFDMLQPPKPMVDLPFRLPIQDVFNIKGVGVVVTGRVISGRLRPGDRVVLRPLDRIVEVKSIEMHHKPLEEALPGDNVGVNIKGATKDEIRRGDVLGDPQDPPKVAEEFVAQVFILRHPTSIGVGYTPVFHVHTAVVACRFEEILEKINPATGEVIEKNPQMLKTGDAARVRLVPLKPLVIEEVTKIQPMARFAIRDMGMTIGAGQCIKVTKEKPLELGKK